MARDIKTTLALDGEAKFKAGLSAINDNFKNLGSEMAAVTSGYDKNNASVKDLTAKGDILNKQVEQQKIKQSALKGALNDATTAYNQAGVKAKDAAEKFGENSKEAQIAADKLSKAQKTLDSYTQQVNYAERDLNKLTSAQKSNNEELKKVEKNTSGIAKLKTSFSDLHKSLEPIGQKLKEVSNISFGALKTGISAMAKGIGATVAATTALAKVGFDYNKEMEGYTTNFETMLGSQEKALGKVEELKKFAASTPLSMADLSEGTKTLLAFGVQNENTTAKLKQLGDISLGNADKMKSLATAYGKATAAGKVSGETISQMINAGFNPLIEISKQSGESMSDLQSRLSAGQVSVSELDAALESVTSTGGQFAGGMEKASHTTEGLLSTLQDNSKALVGEVFKPLSDSILQELLPDALSYIDQLTSSFKEDGVDGLVTAVGDILGQITSKMSMALPSLIETFSNIFNSVIKGLIDVVPTVLPELINGGIMLFTGLLDSLNQVTDKLMPMLPELITKMCDTLVANLPTIIDTGFNILIGLITGIANAIPALIDGVVKLIPIIISGFTDNLPRFFEAGIQIIIALANGLPQAIPAVIKAIPQIVGALIKTIFETDWIDIGIQILKGIALGLIEGAKAIYSVIKEVAGGIVNGFKNFFGIHSPSRVFRDQVGKYLAQGLGLGFTDEMDGVTKKMKNAVPQQFEVMANTTVSSDKSRGISSGGVVFNQYNNSPKALSNAEIYRNTNQGLQLARLGGF